MKNPVIGVTPLYDRERDSLWMPPGYFGGILQAGGIPVMLPIAADGDGLDRLTVLCDGFLFTGGQDVDPKLYGEKRLPQCGESCAARDETETSLLFRALERKKPILGICRGIQLLNVALGGTLYQDLPAQTATEVLHRQSPPYDKSVHTVSLASGSPLRALLGEREIGVNSYHHQGVKTVAKRLEVMATAPDGLAEALFLPELPFVWAVQWHPEFSYRTDENSRKIFRAFVEAAARPV